MKNICYIISGIEKALAFEWITENLDKSKYKLHFILLHNRSGGLESYLQHNNISHKRIHYESKKDLPSSILKIMFFLKQNRIEIVHCHLLDAGIAGLTAAYLSGIRTRIYTRHYSTFHHVYHPKGVWYDRFINFLSTRIVAVTHLVQKILIQKEQVPEQKVTVIHHGFPTDRFKEVTSTCLSALKKKYGIEENRPVLGVISRYIEWKGIQYIIPAFANILEKYPHACLILANARGEYKSEIARLLKAIPERNYREIPFEEDLFTLFKAFDIFIHTPVDDHSEAFGQVYIEALAAGLPCVFTLSGIAGEIIEHSKNALVVPHRDSVAIEKALHQLLSDSSLSAGLVGMAEKSVKHRFELKTMIDRLETLYGQESVI